jgi:uncharacterized membrane protein YkvA (DUF1232 family)
MSTLEIVLLGALTALLVLVAGALLAWWLIGRHGRLLARRIGALPVRQKARLARALLAEPRLPAFSRLVLMALVVYVALPIDIVPDFIPVLGQIDDVVMIALGSALIVRAMPQGVFEEHLSRLEAEAIQEREQGRAHQQQ